MKKLKIIFISMFLLFISLPTIFLNTENYVISEIDNRTLRSFPKLENFDEEYLTDLLAYYDDRYYGRDKAIEIYTNYTDKIFGELVHPSYTYGKDKYVFFRMGNEVYYNDYHQNFVDAIVKIKNYVESKGAKFYMMINPEKASVYTNYLPRGVNYNRNWIEIFESQLTLNNVNYIDNTQELIERSKKELVYDKQYDAGHWNDLGAFYGVNNLLRNINKDFPNVTELNLDNFEISTKKQTSLKVSKFPIDDISPVFNLKNQENYQDLTLWYDDIVLDKQYYTFSYTKNNSDNNNLLPKAMVFQGSYLNGREKYLMSRFSDYIAIHNYQNIFNIDYYFEEFVPDIVIFEVAEYTFGETYFSEEKMNELDLE